MRKLLCILFILMGAMLTYAHEYTDHSVLAQGEWVKIKVTETGLCKITFEELQKQGLNPYKLSIYGYGGAMLSEDFTQPHTDDLPLVPYYKTDKYILFWAQGTTAWVRNGNRIQHTNNPYSTAGYYFLTSSREDAKPLTYIKPQNIGNQTFREYQVWERDSVNLIDPNGADGAGREFYGERFAHGQTKSFRFATPNIVTSQPLQVVVDMAHTAYATGQITVKIGNEKRTFTLPARPAQTHYVKATTGQLIAEFTPQNADIQTVEITYTCPNSNANAYLNYIELSAERKLILTDEPIVLQGSEVSNFAITQGEAASRRLVQGEAASRRLQVNDDWSNLYFNPDNVKTHSATFIGKVANQDLHALHDIDMVLITNDLLKEAAEELAAAHEQIDGLTTAVVTAEQVYNEFSSGTPDATAYRWLMKMLYDKAARDTQNATSETRRPKYLLLVGDGTFDNRALLPASGSHALLTYQARNSVDETAAFASDDYFAYLNDNEGLSEANSEMLIGVGRLPVSTLDEAKAVVAKLINYMRNEAYGDFKQQICFLADDGDSGLHTREADEAAEATRQANPSLIVHKLYTDAYQQTANASGESYPQAQNKLSNLLQKGLLYFDYSGHAGPNNLANEQLITAKMVREMTTNHLALWGLFTCNFAKFDSQVTSAGEQAVLNPTGGALSVIASCRTVFASQNTQLNVQLAKQLFTPNADGRMDLTIGDALRKAKNNMRGDSNKLAYLLLGDPAIRLHYPDDYSVNVAFTNDTLSALSVNELSGEIITHNGQKVTDFNGEVTILLQDKLETLSTLDNDQTDSEQKRPVTYLDYPNTLFKGKAEVKNGEFALQMMIPKDIRYNFGNGRLVAYAYDDSHAEEAMGSTTDFVVGGSSSLVYTDTLGPDIRLYLNNPAFVDGGETGSTPLFYADIQDEYGINTVGNGIGHDLMLVIDDDPQQTYIVNDYFTAEKDSYQAGQVSYRLNELPDGQHYLRFRAWDLLNNSAESSLSFTVVNNLQPILYSVVAYPNPVVQGQTFHITVQHDQPEELLSIELKIYNLQGQEIYREERNHRDNNSTINYQLSTINYPSGLYLYHLTLRTPEGLTTKSTGKIIIR